MAVEIEHDWQRWGSAFSRDEVPRELVRLAEAVKLQMNERTPIRLAATNVIGRLVRLRIDSFFLLVPGHRATELSESVIWRMPASLTPKTATDLGKRQDRGSYAEVWTLSEDRAKDGVFSSDRTKPDALGMQSEWRGRTGMFSCLSECWLAAAKQTSDLDQDIAGRIAILKTDAQRLFGFDDAAAVHQLRPVKPAVPEALVTERRAGMELDGASLLHRHAELSAAKHKAPTQKLVQETGLHEKEIQRRMKPYRLTSAPELRLDNVWIGPSKVHKSK